MAPQINEFYIDIDSMQSMKQRAYEAIDDGAPSEETCATKCSCCCCLNRSHVENVYKLLAVYMILYTLIIFLKCYFHNSQIYLDGSRLLHIVFLVLFAISYCSYKIKDAKAKQ